MPSSKLPKQRSNDKALDKFLQQANTLPQRLDARAASGGRLIFALDATASRQPSWDRACQLQGEMFVAADKLGGLQLQLCYYRGYGEFHRSPWLADSTSLLRQMTAVQCLGGYTQLEKVLKHCRLEHRQQTINAAIIIGDAVEENVDQLCQLAGELGISGIPLFMFQEGDTEDVRRCFQQMALLSKGAYAAFDEHSAAELAKLLAAVATYASGGIHALQQLQSGASRQLLQQLRG